jgi:phosphoglycolate phosphatase
MSAAVLFDTDGVLVDSRAATTGSINYALGLRGLPQCAPETLYRFIGPRLLTPSRSCSTSLLTRAAVLAFRDYRSRYADASLRETTVVPGIREAVAEVKRRADSRWRPRSLLLCRVLEGRRGQGAKNLSCRGRRGQRHLHQAETERPAL